MVHPYSLSQIAEGRPAEDAGEWAILDNNGVILEISAAWMRAAQEGKPPCAGALPGKNYRSLCKLEQRRCPDLEGLWAALRAVLRGQQLGMALRYRGSAEGGRESWKEMTIRQLSAVGDGHVVVSLDTSGSSRERFDVKQDLLARLPVGVLTTTTAGIIEYANPSACRLLGVDEARLIGRDLNTFCERPIERTQLGRLLRQGGATGGMAAVAFRRGHRGLSLRSFEMQNNAIESNSHDWLLQEQDAQSVMSAAPVVSAIPGDAFSQLANGLAHDLNNVLNTVTGFAEIALQQHRNGSYGRLGNHLEAIQSTGQRAQQLVSEFLELGRNGAEAEARFDLAAMLADADRWLGGELCGPVEVTVKIAEKLPPISLGATPAYRILMNLLLNARDAVDGKGRIEISLLRTHIDKGRCLATGRNLAGDWLELRVDDSGPGVPNDMLPYLFDPYVTSKPDGGGIGLGLAVVRQIAQRYGAGVLVHRSESLGGASFCVFLPIHGVRGLSPST